MWMTTSFTDPRGVRHPAPDVAHDFMLLPIAVANVPPWNKIPDGAEPPASFVGSWWMFAHTLVMDHRAYPLFAVLFGFGFMTMINRRIAPGTETYLAPLLDTPEEREPMPHEAAQAHEMTIIDACRLVRCRDWWMLLIGFVHGLVFPDDIIGAYGLVAILLANPLAHKNYSVPYLIGDIILVSTLVTCLALKTLSGGGTPTVSGKRSVLLTVALFWVTANALQWAVVLVVQMLITLVAPAAVIGACLADTDPLTYLERHRRLLVSTGLGGLVLGALAAFHGALMLATTAQLWSWDFTMMESFDLAGAYGWLALLTLYVDGPRLDGRLTGLRRLASAVGHRSMTVYLGQTILFGIIFDVVPLLVTGRCLWMGQAAAALIVLGIWLVSVILYAVLECGGHANPFETLLCTAVTRSKRRRPAPPPPPAVWPGMQAGPQPTP